MIIVDVVCYKYKPLKNKELPLKIKICKDRKTRYINLGVSTKMEYWDFDKNQPKTDCPNKEYLEKLIYSKIGEIREKVIQLKSENKDFSATTLVEKVSNPKKPITVRELFKQHLLCLKEEKRIGYHLSVQQTYNSLLKFNKNLDIYFKEISMWNVYNLLTGANKSSYIDNFLDRSLNATQLAEGINKAIYGDKEYSWFIE